MSNMQRYQELMRRSINQIRAQSAVPVQEEVNDEDDFVSGFANFRTNHDSRPGRTAAAGTYRKKTNPVYSFKIACLDGPAYTKVSPMMIRRLNKCGLGSKKVIISRTDSIAKFRTKIIGLFPKLDGVNFEFFQAKLSERNRLAKVEFATLKDLKDKVKFTIYVKPTQQILNTSETTRETPTTDIAASNSSESTQGPSIEIGSPSVRPRSTITNGQNRNRNRNRTTTSVAAEGRPVANVTSPGSATSSNSTPRNISRRANTGSCSTPLSRNDGRPRRRSAIAAGDFMHAVIAPETMNSQPREIRAPLQSIETNEVEPGSPAHPMYHAAGTPTVQFRSERIPASEQTEQQSTPQTVSSLLDIAREIYVPIGDNHMFDEVPEVEPFGDIGEVQCSDNFRSILKEHKDSFIKSDQDDPFLMEVRRDRVVEDALMLISVAQDDLHSPLRITFTGEDGVDVGGLRREFWSLFLHQFTYSSYVTGKHGRQTLQSNYLARKRNAFFHIGQLTALSILQDGPGLPIFSDIVTDYILIGKPSIYCSDDLLDGVKNVIATMKDCVSATELQNLYDSIFDEAVDAGFVMPKTAFKERHIKALEAALVESQIYRCKEELDQFIKGLDTHQVLSLLKQDSNLASSRSLISGRVKPLTASGLRDLLKFNYSEGSDGPAQQTTGQGFLTFLQAIKNGRTVGDNICIGPKEVLMWMTGSMAVPAIGFHKKIDVCFGSSTFVNTCALALTLKIMPDIQPADAVTYYCELIVNSQTFGKE